MSSKENGTAGNSMQATLEWQKGVISAGAQIMRLETIQENMAEDMSYIKGMSVRVPATREEEVLIVVRAHIEGTDVVAFSSGITVFEALRTTVARLQNKSIKWKVDEYASEG